MRLHLRETIDHLDGQIVALQRALAEKALAHAATIMPGFTHLQAAQPVTFGHHMPRLCRNAGARSRAFCRCAPAAQRIATGCGGACRHALSDRPRHDGKGTWLRPADAQFARCGVVARFRGRNARRSGDLRHASLAACRGDRVVVFGAVPVRGALRQIHHRLVDHAAKAQSRCGGTGARQARADHRCADGASGRAQGPAARLFEGHAGGQGTGLRRARQSVAGARRHDRDDLPT